MPPNGEVKLKSEKGKEILAYATRQEQCILEFRRMDTGEMTVVDITDHVRRLEDEVVGDGPV